MRPGYGQPQRGRRHRRRMRKGRERCGVCMWRTRARARTKTKMQIRARRPPFNLHIPPPCRLSLHACPRRACANKTPRVAWIRHGIFLLEWPIDIVSYHQQTHVPDGAAVILACSVAAASNPTELVLTRDVRVRSTSHRQQAVGRVDSFRPKPARLFRDVCGVYHSVLWCKGWGSCSLLLRL